MKTVYIDMDDTLCNFQSAYRQHIAENPAIRFPQSQYGFFTALTPLDGAVEAVEWLRQSPGFDPYILSAPSVKNPLCYTEKRVWVEKHFGLKFCDRLILCAHKNLLAGDYLIDDYAKGKGQDRFKGELIHFASERFPDWNAVINYLGTRA
ncbi:MAG: hypothetical protein V7739_21060 [Motiliproteus sp.]